ncbi:MULTISPECIES: CsbD family protein [unclassified Brenneria]|uniref:CsbD family protein n=1 Tax=unclassified Brenneria TaxID=2634434 RepID=UPI0029C5ACE4|nr:MULTISPECIES: CsbD family protein [unclassified Brenneria]MDX5627341.1 CsbD family protein [Brenneria sp. L3-3Z]MDX5694503.1 CsbD family protein [Brenneria sp. L4-2C]MEE3661873.1 CsbD family protein [Brenneria sp. g21c3]
MPTQNFDNEAENIVDKVTNKADEAAGAAQEAFGDAVDSPKHKIKGATRKYAAQACDTLCDATDTVASKVKASPIASLLAAGTIGLLIGLLARRK